MPGTGAGPEGGRGLALRLPARLPTAQVARAVLKPRDPLRGTVPPRPPGAASGRLVSLDVQVMGRAVPESFMFASVGPDSRGRVQ